MKELPSFRSTRRFAPAVAAACMMLLGACASDDGSHTEAEQCDDGTFDSDDGPGMACVPWSDCAAGEHVVEDGSATADRTCSACAPQTFASDVNSPACMPWTECGPGDEESAAGTATSDRTCRATEWVRQYGTTLATAALAVSERPDGSLAVAGVTSGTLPGQVGAGSYDAYVRVFDRGGDIVWTRQFGTSGEDTGSAVSTAANGDVVVVGETSAVFSGQVSAGFRDAYVRVYDAAGTLRWTRQLGSSGNDKATAVSVGANGTIAIAGYAGDVLPGQTAAGQVDAFVALFDANGDLAWIRQFGSTSSDQALAVSVDASGVIAVAGDTFGTLPGQPDDGNHASFVRLYTATGDVAWTRQFGSSDVPSVGSEATAVRFAPDGTVVVAGNVIGALPGQTSAGSTDAYLQVFGATGDVVWTRQVGSTESDAASGLGVDSSGFITVTGYTHGTLPEQTHLGGLPDVFARSYDASGTHRWTRQLGTNASDMARGSTVDARGNVVIVGETRGLFAGQSSPSGDIDSFIVRVVPQP